MLTKRRGAALLVVAVVAWGGYRSRWCAPWRNAKELRELQQKRRLFGERVGANYSYDDNQTGFVAGRAAGVLRIRVRDSKIVNVYSREFRRVLSPDPWGLDWRVSNTVEAAFGRLEAAFKAGGASFHVEYDPEYGYPAFVEFGSDPLVTDTGGSWQISNLTPEKQSKPDLSDEWKLNLQASTLSPALGIAPTSGVLWIEHREPSFKGSLVTMFGGRRAESKFELLSDGRETVTTDERGRRIVSSLRWDGDALVVTSRIEPPDAGTTISFRYELQDDGRRLRAAEHVRGGGRDQDNLWVYDGSSREAGK